MSDTHDQRPGAERDLVERILHTARTVEGALDRLRGRGELAAGWTTIDDVLAALGDGREEVLDMPFHRPLWEAPRSSEPFGLAWVQLALALELDHATAWRLYEATVPALADEGSRGIRERVREALAESFGSEEPPGRAMVSSPESWWSRAHVLGLRVLNGPRAIERWIDHVFLVSRAPAHLGVEQPEWLEPCSVNLVSSPPFVRERPVPAQARLEWAASGELLGRIRLNERDLASTQLVGATVLVHEKQAGDAVRFAVSSIHRDGGSVELELRAGGTPREGRTASARVPLGSLRIVVVAP